MRIELQALSGCIIRDSGYDGLDALDWAYLRQVKTVADLDNFQADGTGKRLALALDAAKALGFTADQLAEMEKRHWQTEDAQ